MTNKKTVMEDLFFFRDGGLFQIKILKDGGKRQQKKVIDLMTPSVLIKIEI